MEKRKLTQSGKDNLIKTLNQLRVERLEIVARLDQARQFGDLKENSEFQEARSSLRKIDQEISELEFTIANSVVINGSLSDDSVSFGSKVTIENLETKEKHTYQIVGDSESDISEGLISEESLIAKSMIGKKPGDTFSFETSRGSKSFKIISLIQED